MIDRTPFSLFEQQDDYLAVDLLAQRLSAWWDRMFDLPPPDGGYRTNNGAMLRWIGALGFAGGLISASASAAEIDADARCLAAASVFSSSEKDLRKQQIASAARFFFLGRVDARLSGAQLKSALEQASKELTPETVGPVMTSCAASMQAKVSGLLAVAK